MKKITVIGAGFAGLSAAASLAAEGFDVTILEKNDTPGGRARKFENSGFTFDMGPSWYWMPDIFENFFQRFGKNVHDFYTLKKLDPAYRVYYAKDDFVDMPAGLPAACEAFEKLETGSGKSLEKFLQQAAFFYETGMKDMAYKPSLSWMEFANVDLLKRVWQLQLFQSHSSFVRKFFRNPRILQLLEFPLLFLGASADRIPALYSLMNYADIGLGTWYPMGGMHRIVDAMVTLAKQNGARFRYNTHVSRIVVNKNSCQGILADGYFLESDFIVAGADYRHVEKELLPEDCRQYSDTYWDKKVLAPSCLIFYVGVNKRVNRLLHHTLFFDEDGEDHIRQIYDDPQWPSAPQFYVSCPSKSDPTVAPAGCENLFILVPVAPGLPDDDAVREKYFSMVIGRIEKLTGEIIRPHIVYKRSYAHRDFIRDYNAFKGNAYGLANTLRQTANLKPRIASSKVNNLFFTGQFTVPGPGIPPCIISGQIVADTIVKRQGKNSEQSQMHLKKQRSTGAGIEFKDGLRHESSF